MYSPAALLVSILAVASGLGALAQSTGTTTLKYDNMYDNAALPLDSVSCSNGINGLETATRTTLGQLPGFPNVAGAFAVAGWDSPACGTCWALTFNGNTINVLAVDKATAGFISSEAAMNALTGGRAEEFGTVTVTYAQVSASVCGM